MGSALLNPAAQVAADLQAARTASETPDELRRQVAARLAAHRERRLRRDSNLPEHIVRAGAPQDPQKSRIAAAVAERYAKAQSYRTFLAVEAERAIQQAQAAAEIAARNARAVAEAQQQLLDSLAVQAQMAAQAQASTAQLDDAAWLHDTTPVVSFTEQALWPELDEPVSQASAPARNSRPKPGRPGHSGLQDESTAAAVVTDLPAVRVVLYDDTPAVALAPAPLQKPASQRRNVPEDYLHQAEAMALDEEISFRQAPVFEEPPGPPMPLPANLLEFPRQLVAPRKARPRYAEGPLRDEAPAAGSKEQLRIFEVDPAQVSITPETAGTNAKAEAQWTSIWLDSPSTPGSHAQVQTAHLHAHVASPASTPKIQTAQVSRRLLATSIDLAVTGLAAAVCAVAFTGTSGAIAGQAPWRIETLRAVATSLLRTVPVSTLAMSAFAALLLLWVLLQLVFFTFSEATPGMRLARIGLCTFSDENPSRAAIRRRIPALLLSTAVFGWGFLWSLLDEDRLTWHDLISRMYLRSY